MVKISTREMDCCTAARGVVSVTTPAVACVVRHSENRGTRILASVHHGSRVSHLDHMNLWLRSAERDGKTAGYIVTARHGYRLHVIFVA